jgi:hypothetical protein
MNSKISISNMPTARASDATSQVADYLELWVRETLVEGLPTMQDRR